MREVNIYLISCATKEALENWLDIIKPELDDVGKIEALRRCYMALKLHELPLSMAIFIFDCALRDQRAAIRLKEVAEKNHHWYEILLARIELIGYAHLLELMKYLRPFEEAEHGRKSNPEKMRTL